MIVLTCGPAGVGKTIVATLLHERLTERGLSVHLLDSDQFSRNVYEQMYDRVDESDEHWILAGTFYKRRWQERFEQLADVVVYLKVDLETCLERNLEREDPIDEAAIHIIWHEFHDPDADVTIDATERTPDDVVDRLVAVLESMA